LARPIQWNAFEASAPIPERSEILRLFVSSARPLSPFLRAHVVALVWWRALFGSVTQKEIRAAAAPMNTFAPYCDRDDLNVCKRAQENGDIASRFAIRHADVSLLFVHPFKVRR
jgi:hypothetical protein